LVICLERDADLHIAQLMPLPLTVSCFSKIQIGFTFLLPAHPGRPGQRAVKRVCVCVCDYKKKDCCDTTTTTFSEVLSKQNAAETSTISYWVFQVILRNAVNRKITLCFGV